MIEFTCTDSLVKIFPDTRSVRPLGSAAAIASETYRKQLFVLSLEMRREI